MLGEDGLTVIDTGGGGVTASVADPEIVPSAAAIVAVPAPALVANPIEPNMLLTTATAALELLQAVVCVMSSVLPSL
jgi:hypothetical protein